MAHKIWPEYDKMDIGEGIITWYNASKRDLPWRNTREPYKIWLSEIILQQTRVIQGTPYYNRFVRLFPTVFDLALAPQDIVLSAWQGLGYYSRAHNLHKTSKIIAFERKGEFPKTYLELKKLPGIGEYTAAAIASFSYNESVPVLDGNVYRVLSRLLGMYNLPNNQKSKLEYRNEAIRILADHDPASFNQGMMEFGAILCKPQNPNCQECPVSKDCFAFNQDKVGNLPVKKIKNPLKRRYFNYLVYKTPEGYLIKKREGKDIWPGLFEFPLIETDEALNWTELQKRIEDGNEAKDAKEKKDPQKFETSQVLSHQKIFFTYWIFEEGTEPKETEPDAIWVREENLNKYAFPKVSHKLVEEIILNSTIK